MYAIFLNAFEWALPMNAYPSMPTPIVPTSDSKSRDGSTMRDRRPRGDAVNWGIVSTADINRKVIPGAKASPKVDLSASQAVRRSAPSSTRAVGDPARVRQLRGAARRRRDRGRLHLAAEHLHCEWSIKALEAGKHVLCEKPLSRHPDEVAAAFDAAERTGRLLSEAFMWRHNPQTAAAEGAGRPGRDRRAPPRPLDVQLLALRRGQHPPAHRRRRRRADGRRLLQHLGLAVPRRRAGARLRRGVVRPDRHRLGVRRHDALPRRRDRDASTAAPRCRTATSSRRSAAKARCSSTTRGTASSPGSSCGATARSSGSSSSRRTPTGSSSRT